MIRKATPFDMPALIQMMRGYVAEAPMDVLKDETLHNQSHIESVFAGLMAGRGFILVDDQQQGFIAAMITSNVWCPKISELHELAWWVRPDRRGGTIGGRLWKAFDLLAQGLLDAGRVQIICSSAVANSPKIGYTKRGYKLMQTTYFKEL